MEWTWQKGKKANADDKKADVVPPKTEEDETPTNTAGGENGVRENAVREYRDVHDQQQRNLQWVSKRWQLGLVHDDGGNGVQRNI